MKSPVATFMQIDLQNLFYTARKMGHKIDFDKLWAHFREREAEFLTEAAVYMIRSNFDSKDFEEKLKRIGYTLRIKHAIKDLEIVKCPEPYDQIIRDNVEWDRMDAKEVKTLQNFLNGIRRPVYTRTNHDTNMIVECMDRLHTFDKWILMSGDGDFTDLAAYLKARGKNIEIWSFKESYSVSLEQYADRRHFIQESFFYNPPKIKWFGFNWRDIG